MKIYKITDDEKTNSITLRDGVRYKNIFGKAESIKGDLYKLQSLREFSLESEECQREIFRAIGCIEAFNEGLLLRRGLERK